MAVAEEIAAAYDPFHDRLRAEPYPLFPSFAFRAGARLGSANRDDFVVQEPCVVDVERANATAHLSLGRGIHVCLGAALARLEARVTLELLGARLLSLRLVAGQDVHFVPNTSFRGLIELEVEWDV